MAVLFLNVFIFGQGPQEKPVLILHEPFSDLSISPYDYLHKTGFSISEKIPSNSDYSSRSGFDREILVVGNGMEIIYWNSNQSFQIHHVKYTGKRINSKWNTFMGCSQTQVISMVEETPQIFNSRIIVQNDQYFIYFDLESGKVTAITIGRQI